MTGPRTSTSHSAELRLPSFVEDGLEAAAIRGRVAGRLFGAAPTPVRIGRYEIGDRIGAGGMGVVYAALDPELGRQVALKVLAEHRGQDPRNRQRLLEEARALARLSHPNVVQIHEIGEHEGAIFLALELVEGETMATWQRRPERRWPEILAAYVEAARGLAAAHSLGVIHRDVKPSNILVGADGRVRVADFGLAQAAAPAAEPTSTDAAGGSAIGSATASRRAEPVAGTPAYMSPEQASGRACDARSDLYSLCVSLFEGLHGVRPFEGRGEPRGEIDARALWRQAPRGSKAPRWVLEVLARGLQRAPERRFGDMQALIAAIEATPRRIGRRRAALGATLGLALGVWGVATVTAAPPACPAPTDALPGAWDPAGKAALAHRFRGSGLPFAEAAWRQVERSLDAAVIDWSRARQTSCVRTRIERTQSAEQFDLAAACLDGHERSIRDLVARLATGGQEVITQAHLLVGEIGDPGRCTSTEALRGGPPPPATEALRERVAALRRGLDEVRFMTITAAFAEASTRATAIVEAAEIHPPLRAEAVFRRGVVAARQGALEAAARDFEAAAAGAEASRDDRLAAAILGEQMELATRGRRDVAAARIYAGLYGAKLARIGADAGTRAEQLDRLGELALLAGEADAALARHEEAATLRTMGDLTGRARSLRGIANALAELGQVDASLARLGDARDLLARELGASHPATAAVEVNLAQSLRERPEASVEDLLRAEALLRGALAVELRHGAADGLAAARVRLALSELLGARGEVGPALAELERALGVLEDRLPPGHDDLVNAWSLAFNLHLDARAWEAAAAAVTALLRIFHARGEPIPFELLHNAGEVHLRLGDALAATPFFDQALALATLADPPEPQLAAYALNGRAKVYLLQGEPALARALFERALASLAGVAEAPPELVGEAQWGAAQALARTGGPRARARRLAAEALPRLRVADPTAPQVAEIEAFLAGRAG